MAFIIWRVIGRLLNSILKRSKIKGANIIDCNFKVKNINRNYYSTELIRDNSYYGHKYILSKYFNDIDLSKIYIEHGVFFGNHIQKQDQYRFSKKVITFSNRRVGILRKNTPLDPLAVGPYIRYAKSSKEMEHYLKERYGNYLLHFPYHSTQDLYLRRDKTDLIEPDWNYDNVLACVFYRDLKDDALIKKLTRKGFKIVTAGHRFNPQFLENLKSLINASIFTTSDYIGTHVGYCMYLMKPHYIYNSVELSDFYISDRIPQAQLDNIRNSAEELSAITEIISRSNGTCDRSREILNEYWGADVDFDKSRIF